LAAVKNLNQSFAKGKKMKRIVTFILIGILYGGFLSAQSGWNPIGPEGGFLYFFAVKNRKSLSH
jgi:hypothetical protein